MLTHILTVYRLNSGFRDGKDQGANVRERAKQLVGLLQDEDRLRSEREKSLKNKVQHFYTYWVLTNIRNDFQKRQRALGRTRHNRLVIQAQQRLASACLRRQRQQ